jgi:hypothetical protein
MVFKMKTTFKIDLVLGALLMSLSMTGIAIAQFPNKHPDPTMSMPPTPLVQPPVALGAPSNYGTSLPDNDGPIVIGRQILADTGKVAVIQAPSEPTTSFSIGTWIADLLGGLVALFGSVIATFITKWVIAVAKKAGVDATQAMSDRLDQIIENGLHAGAINLGHDLTGKLNVQVKDAVIASAVTYAQNHGADTIKSISGLNINDPKTVEALQARAAKALSTIGPDAVLAATPAAVVNVKSGGPTTVETEKPAPTVASS